MEGNAHHFVFPEDGVLLGRNVSEQNEIVHVTLKLGLISCANVIT
jgi:hypothetical protein